MASPLDNIGDQLIDHGSYIYSYVSLYIYIVWHNFADRSMVRLNKEILRDVYLIYIYI